ncbi:MAG: hypothetical protein B6A08_11020 [Sorangiineae bacterium NIC37A_2]|nr:MAG: hypothetical protein B6A08_11020 [Sorangiineae bacterium NIC37A_2]
MLHLHARLVDFGLASGLDARFFLATTELLRAAGFFSGAQAGLFLFALAAGFLLGFRASFGLPAGFFSLFFGDASFLQGHQFLEREQYGAFFLFSHDL